MYRGIIVLQSVSLQYVWWHYCTTVCINVVYTGELLYCSQYRCSIYRGIIVLQSVSLWYIQGHYCTAVSVSWYVQGHYCTTVRVRWYIQGHYCTAGSVSVVLTGSLWYCSLCQWSVHSGIIVMQSLSMECVQGHYCNAVSVNGVCTGALL